MSLFFSIVPIDEIQTGEFCYIKRLALLIKFSACDILIFFLFLPENMIWHFGDNLYEKSTPGENKKNITNVSSAELAKTTVV